MSDNTQKIDLTTKFPKEIKALYYSGQVSLDEMMESGVITGCYRFELYNWYLREWLTNVMFPVA